MPRHLRNGDPREDRGRGDGDAGDRGEDRIRGDRGDTESAEHAPEELLRHLEGVAAHIGDADQKPHQDEEGNGREEIIRDAAVGGELQHSEGEIDIVPDQPDADEGDSDERIGYLHPDEHERHEDNDEKKPQSEGRHRVVPRRMRP